VTIFEQLRRIAIAAPYLPIQAIASISMFVAIYVCTSQGIEQLTTNWMETNSISKDFGRIFNRTIEGEPEFFFAINYSFDSDGTTYSAKEEKTYSSQQNAELGLSIHSRKTDPIKIYFDRDDPTNYQFENRIDGYAVLSLNLIFIGMLAYFRWLMLKYYELEIEK